MLVYTYQNSFYLPLLANWTFRSASRPAPQLSLLSRFHNTTFAVKAVQSGSVLRLNIFALPIPLFRLLSSLCLTPDHQPHPLHPSAMLSIIAISFLSLLSTALATHETISGSGTLPPYPTYSAPYPMSNSTIPTYPTATAPSPPPTSIISPTASSSTSECPPPVTVTVTDSITVTTTITTSKGVPFPPGSGTGGTAAPTGTAAVGYYRRSLEMRGLNYREGRVGWKEKRSGWWSWF